jgi:hypothetical protein
VAARRRAGLISAIARVFPLYHPVEAFDACFVPQTTDGGWAPG